jgi:hypothetical protein
VSRTHLPGDIDCEAGLISRMWQSLHEMGLLESIPGQDPTEGRVQVKLVCRGVNESRNPPPVVDVEFGHGVVPRPMDNLRNDTLMVGITDEERRTLYEWVEASLENQAILRERLAALLEKRGGKLMEVSVIGATVLMYMRIPTGLEKEEIEAEAVAVIRHLLGELVVVGGEA